MNSVPLVVEKLIHASPSRIWKAMTDNTEMKKWYFNIPDFEPLVGYEFTFPGGNEERTYTHLCRIMELIPGKKLSYSWQYEGLPGNTLVTFDLVPEGEDTLVRITHAGLETFPADLPDLARENFKEGWESIAGKSLRDYVENDSNAN